MKKLLLFLSIIILSSFATRLYYDVRQSTAEVNQEQGVYIFVDSKPVKKYEYLGTVKVSIAWDNDYTTLKNVLVKKLKKEYPQANGAIIMEIGGNVPKADAILIEE